MRFTPRESKIIIDLLDSEMSINHLASKNQVSTKTLKTDISSINSKIFEYNSKIDISSNVLKFESIYSRVHWRNIVKLNKTIEEEDLVFLKLLFKENYITMSDFAAELYISKSKLEKLLATVPNFNTHVIKKRNVGIKIELDNYQKIMLATSILIPYVDDLNYLVTARALVQQIIDAEISIQCFNEYIAHFNKVTSQYTNISDKECKITILVIILSNSLGLLNENQINQIISTYIKKEDRDEKLIHTLNEIVRDVLDSNNVQFTNMKIYEIFMSHIKNSITNHHTNTISEEMELRLRTEYSYAYSVAAQLYKRICITLSVDIAQYEKNYYTLYIQSMINNCRTNNELKILIVCQYGLSVSNYIHTWLERNLQINFECEVSSIYSYWKLSSKSDKFDIIITTVDNLENDYATVIKIDSVPLEKHLLKLEQKIMNIEYQTQIEQFFKGYVLKNIKITTIEQMYQLINDDLDEQNPDFIKLMKKRTDEGLSTVNNIIIMHSDGKLVNNSKLLIYKLDRPINYNGMQIKMIFVFAFASEFITQYNSVIKQIYRVIYLEQYVHALYESTSEKQFMWILKNKLKQKNN